MNGLLQRQPYRLQSLTLKDSKLTCLGFDTVSERGYRRDDGLRIVGFERRVTIAFVVDENQVMILRLFYGGQNWEDKFQ
jgi:hypothetical protein